jgi:hypothetical protein
MSYFNNYVTTQLIYIWKVSHYLIFAHIMDLTVSLFLLHRVSFCYLMGSIHDSVTNGWDAFFEDEMHGPCSTHGTNK